jgi:crotonobetainyl-CoA:carnitine CoA-transferase CaiB-like acyl-CoA transferase
MGNDHPAMAPHGVYPAAGQDRWVSIAVKDDAEWRALAKVIGAPELGQDQRFATAVARRGQRQALDAIVSAWTKVQDANAAAQALQAAGVPAHASWTAGEIVEDPHLRQRHAIVEVAEPDGKARAAVGAPVRLSKCDGIGIDRGTPKLGEHEEYVFGELLGLSRAERQALEDEGVIH